MAKEYGTPPHALLGLAPGPFAFSLDVTCLNAAYGGSDGQLSAGMEAPSDTERDLSTRLLDADFMQSVRSAVIEG